MVKRVTVSLNKEIVESLKLIAIQEKKSISEIVREAIEGFILYQKRKQVGENLLNLVEKRPQLNKEEALKELERLRREW